MLFENEKVTAFLVGEIGVFEVDAYDTVLEVKKEYSDIKIVLVISKISELHSTSKNCIESVIKRRGMDDFIYPDKYAKGYKRLSIVYRNRYIIENADFIIAYNKYRGKAYNCCLAAKNRGITVIDLF